MALGFTDIRNRATTFAYENKNNTYEMGESQTFWNEFFEVFGISHKRVANFEQAAVKATGNKGRIDVFWPGTLLIEQKSRGQDLTKAYTQARDYFPGISDDELPKYILVCDFHTFHLYNVMRGTDETFTLAELPSKVELFSFMVGRTFEKPSDNEKVSIQASEKMASLYDSLKAIGYPETSLKQYLVRLLFCLFADDTGIFDRGIFHELVINSEADGSNLADILRGLFERLNTPLENRLKTQDRFVDFPYVNGGLFAEPLPTAGFDDTMRKTLLDACAFDWGHITPSIFGSMFQAAMSMADRRNLGAHYTEENNILKVINPLFMNDLRTEFELVKSNNKKLTTFHEKLASLRFLDPACGTGNFLIIGYRELRRLEIEVIAVLRSKNQNVSIDDMIDVSHNSLLHVNQFYGIEIDPLAVEIAKVGMYLVDHQCNMELSTKFGQYYARLPLEEPAVVVQANALQVEWLEVLGTDRVDYVFGNPPFFGARMMDSEQKEDLKKVLVDSTGQSLKEAVDMDYVAGWYYKASRLMLDYPKIRTALVSTNSIAQGEQATNVWKTLMENYQMKIDFAYPTFVWTSQARGKAAVHCVIIGFSHKRVSSEKVIFEGDLTKAVENINGYLVDAPSIFITARKSPLCDVPGMKFGSQPRDGGHFVLTPDEREDILTREPDISSAIKPYIGAEQFLQGKERYCVWLHKAPWELWKDSKELKSRIEKVYEFRSASKAKTTNQYANDSTIFAQIAHPYTDYLIIPSVSSENRKYVPIGFMSKEVIASNLVMIVPNAELYHFGVLTSSVHMAWMRAVCGRLESRYRYSKDIVYNNFPWPTPTDIQRTAIETAAQAVLDARAQFPGETLATLYNPTTMPPTLAKAHRALDKAVSKAYGDQGFMTEAERVADLMERYQVLMAEKKKE